MQSPAIYQTSLTIPTGATSGARITIVGTTIKGFYADGNLAWELDVSTNFGLTTFFDALGALVGASVANGTITLNDQSGDQTQIFTKSPSNVAGISSTHITTFVSGINDRSGIWLLLGDFGVASPQAAGAWVPSHPGNTASVETWQTPSLGAGWDTLSIGFRKPVQYRVDAEDNLVIKGAMSANSGTPSTTPFTVGNAYIPLDTFSLPMLQISSAKTFKSVQQLKILGISDTTPGQIVLQGFAYAIGDVLNFDVCIPLGNIT